METTGDELLSLLTGANLGQDADENTLLPDQPDIHPTPCFTIKTKDATGQKVFINVCTSPLLPPPPPSWPRSGAPMDPLIEAFLTSGNLPQDAMTQAMVQLNIPFRLSEPRPDLDHAEAICTVLDAVCNPAAVEAAHSFRPLKSFMVCLLLEEAKSALGRELDLNFKLPRMRSKGRPAPLLPLGGGAVGGVDGGELRMPGKTRAAASKVRSAKIQEVPPPLPPAAGGGGGDATAATKAAVEKKENGPLRYTLKYYSEERTDEEALKLNKLQRLGGGAVLTVKFSEAEAARVAAQVDSVRILVGGDCWVQIFVPGREPLRVALPLGVRLSSSLSFDEKESAGDGAVAEMDVESGTLSVRLPFAPFVELGWRKGAAASSAS